MEKLTNGLNRRLISDNETAKIIFDKLRQYEDAEEFFGVDLLNILQLLENDRVWYINKDNHMVCYADTERLFLSIDREEFILLDENDEPIYIPFKNIAATPYELDTNDQQKTSFIYRFKCNHCKNRNHCIESYSLQSEWREQMLECWENFKNESQSK